MRVREQRPQRHVGARRHFRLHDVVARAGRDLELAVDQRSEPHLALGRTLREDEADLGTVLRFLAVRRVVHLEHDRRAGANQHGRAGIEAERARAGREPGDERADALRPREEALSFGACGVGVGRSRLSAGDVHALREPEAALPRFRLGGPHRHDHVVDHFARARPDLDRLHPLVLGEVRRNLEVLVFHESICGHLVVRSASRRPRPARRAPSHRRTSAPAGGPSDLPGRAVVRPALDDGLLLIAQAALVGELAVGLVGMPRRHDAGDDLVADLLRVRPRAVVREERHRRDLARPVTAGAVLVKDRRDVFREGRYGAPGAVLAGRAAAGTGDGCAQHDR